MTQNKIYEWARVVNEDDLVMHGNVQIDDFVFLNAKGGTYIGKNSCIHSGSKLVGGGECEIGRNVAVTYNCVLVTEYPDPSSHMSTMVPRSQKENKKGKITIGDEAFIGSNSVVMPGTEVGEGAVIGALSYVDQDVPDWTIRYPNGVERQREEIDIY